MADFVRRFQARVYGLALASSTTGAGRGGGAGRVHAGLAYARDSYDPRRGRVVTWLLTITRNLPSTPSGCAGTSPSIRSD